MRIGIDFDNTLTDMDTLLTRLVREQGWFDADAPCPTDKNTIRQRIRALDDGESKWQHLQAALYGPWLHAAPLRAGAGSFLLRAKERRATVFIVSHKTRFARQDQAQRHDLRLLATAWMTRQGLFDPHRFAVNPEHLHFADTRAEKAERIAQLRCDHFIDDLPELFAEPEFPATTNRLLLDPTGAHGHDFDHPVFASWNALEAALLGSPP
ncbi:MAG: hypothetical protein HQL99_02480 [Magnetococcales bacterium]|nr:hypothetical protein [Magnetococcales bacterium]